ncbi:MAG: hypothetical protein ACT4OO_09330 [Nitrospiraceae bacterium]
MRFVSWRLARRRIPILVVAALGCMIAGTEAEAEELPLTRNVPIPDFQNRQQDVKPYNFDAPPEGMFRSITVAEGFEEELSFRRQHEMVPVNITDRFRVDSPAVFIVFQLHQHYQAFQVFGLCYPEEVPGLDSTAVVTKDAMYIALEDESGYLRLFPPKGSWTPGRYKVEIHVGEQINDISLIGTMRFTVSGGS